MRPVKCVCRKIRSLVKFKTLETKLYSVENLSFLIKLGQCCFTTAFVQQRGFSSLGIEKNTKEFKGADDV